ncbi:MAG TPA: hypothetical protein PK886_02100 [Candidatus Paceibacterota bacterium]|nr:hypothetical protein [Candidatus Paceibacterota bacterium]
MITKICLGITLCTILLSTSCQTIDDSVVEITESTIDTIIIETLANPKPFTRLVVEITSEGDTTVILHEKLIRVPKGNGSDYIFARNLIWEKDTSIFSIEIPSQFFLEITLIDDKNEYELGSRSTYPYIKSYKIVPYGY